MRAAILHPVGELPSKPFTMAELCQRAGNLASLPVSTLKSRRRGRNATYARFAIMYVARRRKPSATYPWIARNMGLRNHTSVIYGISQAHLLIESDSQFKAFVDALEAPYALQEAA